MIERRLVLRRGIIIRVARSRAVTFTVAASVVLALALVGCGDGSDAARERAIEQAKDAFQTAVRQGVDLKRTPCIYYPNAPDGINTWFALVVFPDDESPRAAAIAAGCPGARKLGYVALNEAGEVVDVRLDPVAGSGD